MHNINGLHVCVTVFALKCIFFQAVSANKNKSTKGTSSARGRGKQPARRATVTQEVIDCPEQSFDDTFEDPQLSLNMDEEVESLSQNSLSQNNDVNVMAPGRPLGSMPITPRTSHVSTRDRQKIQLGKFVEFSALRPAKVSCKAVKKYTLNLEKGQFEHVEEEEHLSLYNWYDAFIVFMSIRLEYAPEEAQGLLRHWQVVRGLQNRKKDGVYYDCQFRRLKEQHPDIVWGEYLAELVAEVPFLSGSNIKHGSYRNFNQHASGSGNEFRPFSRTPPVNTNDQKFKRAFQPGRPPRFCFFFNLPRGCVNKNCAIPHKCRRCFKFGHSVQKCRQPQ